MIVPLFLCKTSKQYMERKFDYQIFFVLESDIHSYCKSYSNTTRCESVNVCPREFSEMPTKELQALIQFLQSDAPCTSSKRFYSSRTYEVSWSRSTGLNTDNRIQLMLTKSTKCFLKRTISTQTCMVCYLWNGGGLLCGWCDNFV